MNFWKKLVILSGKSGRGTAVIEQNGLGIFVTLNAYSLPDLSRGEYAVGIKTPQRVLRRELGSLGGIKVRFALPQDDYTGVHLVLFTTFDDEVVMYGTTAENKLWEANLMDGLRSDRSVQTQDYEKIAATAQDFKYSGRKIEDWFLNIEPPKEYYDGALAEVNYYDSGEYYAEPPRPSDTVKNYLRRKFGESGEVLGLCEQAVNAATDESVPTADSKPDENQTAASSPEEVKKIKSASMYTVEQAVAAVKTEASFYSSVKPQIDKLFKSGERFVPLENALPGTRWVKINYDDKGRYYTVGLIGAAPDYVAYAVPGKYNEFPSALDGADFIPLDDGVNGFWALFQSAQTGEEIKKPQNGHN